MKYWIGYLVAAVFAAITWALHQFAAAHQVLVDMIYPYISRMIVTTLAGWNAGGSPVYQTLLIVGFLVLLVTIVLMFIFRFIVRAINKVFKLPVINGLNMFLGGCLGAVKGGIAVLIFCFVVSVVMMLSSGGFWIFNQENIDSTYLFRYIFYINPFIK